MVLKTGERTQPSAVARELSGLTVDDAKGGFVIALKLPKLAEGQHKVIVHAFMMLQPASGDGSILPVRKVFKEFTLTIDKSATAERPEDMLRKLQ